MRKNMSLCRRVVGTSLLAITLLGMSSNGLKKVSAETETFETELRHFVTKFKDSAKSNTDIEYKRAVASLSDELLNYLMLKVVADYNIDPNAYISSSSDIASGLNYLGTSQQNKNSDARKIVFEEMKKRITERGKLKSDNKALTDEARYQQGRNIKLSAV
ncbi:hypothetical protein, partial [Streptococcus canis]|uniref:hypothetical protein n=1 Tax=Streptococcus canis TaxID=1329 RepID=UPI0013308652